MKFGWKVAIGIALIVLGGGSFAAWRWVHARKKLPPAFFLGAVIRQDNDPRKELPIANVEISAAVGLAEAKCRSDSSGFFRLALSARVSPVQPVTLHFRHPGYQPLDLTEISSNGIYIARMVQIPHEASVEPIHTEVVVANVRVRYSVKAKTELNVGSAVRTFQVVNTANVPCLDRRPCSPDGKWKAAIGSISLDVGQGNEFRNARVSCIAGPCPFTRIESDNFSESGHVINVAALGWSDTTTFLLEAEVVRSAVSDIVRQSYPVIFGEALNFILPGGAEGVCIEAELSGQPIVFPLGPDLLLSWADCNARVNGGQTKVYRCELKPGYRFP